VSANVFDGKSLLNRLNRQISRSAERIHKQRHVEVGLGILLVTGDQVSMSESAKIAQTAESLGINVHMQRVAQRNIGRQFYPVLEEYAVSPFIQGIYIQLPLPTEILPLDEVMKRLPPDKDVAGMHYINRGIASYPADEIDFSIHPPENLAVIAALKECKVPLKGGKVVVVGTNTTVGPVKLLASHLYNEGCEVRTMHLSSIKRIEPLEKKKLRITTPIDNPEKETVINPDGEAVVTWTNSAGWLTKSMLKPGSVVMDMGYKFVRGHISGDCDFPSVIQTASAVTPVPGGIRNIIQIMILQNLISLIQRKLDMSDADVKSRLQRKFGSKQLEKGTGFRKKI